MSTMEKPSACEACRRSKVKCNRDGEVSSCARCQRLGQPCVQRFTSTTFVVRAGNGGGGGPITAAAASVSAPPLGCPSLHASSNSSTAPSSGSQSPTPSNGAAAPLPPPLPPTMLGRPAGAGVGGIGLPPPPVAKMETPLAGATHAEELQLLAVGPRAVAEGIIASFLCHAGRIRRDGDILTWTGVSPAPGPMLKPFYTLAQWRHLLQYYSADYSWGVLATATAVLGDPPFTLPPPPLPAAASGMAPLGEEAVKAQLTTLNRGTPITCYRGMCGCDDAPRPVFGADDEQCPLLLVCERGAGGMTVHVSAAFEELFMPAVALGQYMHATRCLPLFAAARLVAQEGLADFADAAFQAMFLGDGNGITSVLSKIHTRHGAEPIRCLCRFRAVPPAGPNHPSFFALAFLPLPTNVAAAPTAIGGPAPPPPMTAPIAAAPPPPPSHPYMPRIPPPSMAPAAPPLPPPPPSQPSQQHAQIQQLQHLLQFPPPPRGLPPPPPMNGAGAAAGGHKEGGGGGGVGAGGPMRGAMGNEYEYWAGRAVERLGGPPF